MHIVKQTETEIFTHETHRCSSSTKFLPHENYPLYGTHFCLSKRVLTHAADCFVKDSVCSLVVGSLYWHSILRLTFTIILYDGCETLLYVQTELLSRICCPKLLDCQWLNNYCCYLSVAIPQAIATCTCST